MGPGTILLIQDNILDTHKMRSLMRRIACFLLVFASLSKAFSQTAIKSEIVSLPFEIIIKKNEKLLIKENGIIEFNNKEFVYKKAGAENPLRRNEAMVTIYNKNNLCGVDIIEEVWNGDDIVSNLYTQIINTKTLTEVILPRDPFCLINFFSIENCFVAAFAGEAYGFDDSTGDLLWTQTYDEIFDMRIIIDKDHFIIHDDNGNRYKIYSDGKKEEYVINKTKINEETTHAEEVSDELISFMTDNNSINKSSRIMFWLTPFLFILLLGFAILLLVKHFRLSGGTKRPKLPR